MEKKKSNKTTTKKVNGVNKKVSANKKNNPELKSIEKTTPTKKTSSVKKKNNISTRKPIEKIEEIKKKEPNTSNNKKYFTKRNIIIAIIAIFCIVFIICFLNRNSSTESIELEAYADGLYAWQYEIKDKSIVKFVEKTRTGDLKGETQEGLIIEKYSFKSLKTGKTTIIFTFINTKNKSFLDRHEYNVIVDKDLKLTIEEKKN